VHVVRTNRRGAPRRALFVVHRALFLDLLGPPTVVVSLYEKPLDLAPSLVTEKAHSKLQIVDLFASPPADSVVGVLWQVEVGGRVGIGRLAHLLAERGLVLPAHRAVYVALRGRRVLLLRRVLLFVIDHILVRGGRYRTLALIALLL
jgi:hypothetical protein